MSLGRDNSTIPTTYWDGEDLVEHEVHPPVIFRAQAELFNTLMANGIDVYVVTAAAEELVRMVASDPKYGYNVPAENVIGVTTYLHNTTTSNSSNTLTTSRNQIASGTYSQQANLDLTFGSYLSSPLTWYAGKWAGILTFIDAWRKPVLVGGDSPGSDGVMLVQGVDPVGEEGGRKGGVRLFVNKSESAWEEWQGLVGESEEGQRRAGVDGTAKLGWVVVRPEEIL